MPQVFCYCLLFRLAVPETSGQQVIHRNLGQSALERKQPTNQPTETLKWAFKNQTEKLQIKRSPSLFLLKNSLSNRSSFLASTEALFKGSGVGVPWAGAVKSEKN